MNAVIVNIIKDVVAATSAKLLTQLQSVDPLITGVHFEYGHYTDIQERLTAKGKTAKFDRYPLVCLFEDFKIRHRKEGLTGVTDMKIIILHSSKNTITRQQREDNVFVPILYPIYEEFLNQLDISGNFMIYDKSRIIHDQINRPHWGDPAMYKNESYLFGDVLDGIELSNLQLETYLEPCEISSNGIVTF
jgi:hypothetical protein